jgi:hypothetical protein
MRRPSSKIFIILFFLGLGVARAAEPALARDVLVYPDGDRVQGRLVGRKDGVIVFQSDRFGELRVPADMATVILASTVPASPGAATTAATAIQPPPAIPAAGEAHAESVAEARGTAGLARLAATLREYFKPWSGRLAFSTEIVSDTAERSTISLEGRLNRKWSSNEVQLGARYDYSETNDLTTTDMVKADGLWRHNLSKNSFAQYRPTVEWNRANFRLKVPADYVLLQQEIGYGISLFTRPERRLRVGVSENLFDVWNASPPTSHNSRTSESAFVETELRLPWGLLLSDRGVYYFSIASQNEGWENRAELTKKFTKTLSTSIRHETRQGNPDGTAQDYTRLRLLLGLDF